MKTRKMRTLKVYAIVNSDGKLLSNYFSKSAKDCKSRILTFPQYYASKGDRMARIEIREVER